MMLNQLRFRFENPILVCPALSALVAPRVQGFLRLGLCFGFAPAQGMSACGGKADVGGSSNRFS